MWWLKTRIYHLAILPIIMWVSKLKVSPGLCSFYNLWENLLYIKASGAHPHSPFRNLSIFKANRVAFSLSLSLSLILLLLCVLSKEPMMASDLPWEFRISHLEILNLIIPVESLCYVRQHSLFKWPDTTIWGSHYSSYKHRKQKFQK